MSAGPYCEGCGRPLYVGHKPGCKGPPPPTDESVRFIFKDGSWKYRTVSYKLPAIDGFTLHWTDPDNSVPYYREN